MITAIWQALSSFGSWLGGWFSWLHNAIGELIKWLLWNGIDFLSTWVDWLWSPATWVEWVISAIGAVCTVVGNLLPDPLGDKVAGFGGWLTAVPFQEGCSVAMFFLTAFVHQDVLEVCFRAGCVIFVATFTLKVVMWIKFQIWSAAA